MKSPTTSLDLTLSMLMVAFVAVCILIGIALVDAADAAGPVASLVFHVMTGGTQ